MAIAYPTSPIESYEVQNYSGTESAGECIGLELMGVDEIVHVAVGKNARKAESLVLWAIKTNRGRRLCIFHIHPPPKLFGARVSQKVVGENICKKISNKEKLKMMTMLEHYTDLCVKEQVPASKLLVESENLEEGILDLISRFNIRWLMLGGPAENNYERGMRESVSLWTRNVLKRAPPSCSIIYNGSLFYKTILDAEEGNYGVPGERENGASDAIITQDTDIITCPANNEDLVSYQSSDASPLVGLIMELRVAKAEAETYKEIVFDETEKDENAERKLNEVEDVLVRKKGDPERLQYERDDLARQLRDALNQKALLEKRLVGFDSSMKQLQEKFLSAVELMSKYKHEVEDLRAERHKAQEVRENPSLGPSTCMQPQIFTEFSFSDIEEATCNFDPSLKIGEGGYGVIYQGFLRRNQVAIKVLRPNSMQGFSEFQQEVDVLGKIRHPNVVTLIGACPETWTLIYEYLPNGSLEDRLNCKGNSLPLNWQTRIRIITELCSVLIFLHSNKQHCIVHGDLKPSNILLDANFVSKLSDFGICRLLRHAAESGQTRTLLNTDPKGTFAYIDPEFQWSGELSPKSDVYSFGVLLLRMLTGRHALGVAREVQNALDTNILTNILDSSAGEWPFILAEQLARLALRCCASKQANRPDLTAEVWSVLEPMKGFCSSPYFHSNCSENMKPSPHFICPILQEVMRDPHVAADGFTYEAEAVRAWFDSGHTSSPMTNLKLAHCGLVPNRALRSAIQEWQLRMNAPT